MGWERLPKNDQCGPELWVVGNQSIDDQVISSWGSQIHLQVTCSAVARLHRWSGMLGGPHQIGVKLCCEIWKLLTAENWWNVKGQWWENCHPREPSILSSAPHCPAHSPMEAMVTMRDSTCFRHKDLVSRTGKRRKGRMIITRPRAHGAAASKVSTIVIVIIVGYKSSPTTT